MYINRYVHISSINGNNFLRISLTFSFHIMKKHTKEDAEKLEKKDAKEWERYKGFVERKYFICKKCDDLEFEDEDQIILHFKQTHPPSPPPSPTPSMNTQILDWLSNM